MSFFVKTSYLLAIVLMFSSMSVFGQKKDRANEIQGLAICTPDCSNDRFKHGSKMPTFEYQGCSYTVFYYYRKACGQYCDIQIWKVEGSCASYENMGAVLEEAKKAAIADALDNDFLDCGPREPGDCAVNWRVSKGGCWRTFGEGLHGIIPCFTDACCLEFNQVCMDPSGKLEITAFSGVVLGSDICEYGYARCEPTCGQYPPIDPPIDAWEDDPWEIDPWEEYSLPITPSGLPPSIKQEGNTFNNSLNNINVYNNSDINGYGDNQAYFRIAPNPIEEEVNIEFALMKEGQVKIVLIDALGSQSIIWEGQSVAGKHQQNVSFSNFSKGNYTLLLKVNDKPYTQTNIVIK